MDNNSSKLTEIVSQVEILQNKVIEYKRLLNDQGLSIEQLVLSQEGKLDDPISLNTYLQKQSYEEKFSSNKKNNVDY